MLPMSPEERVSREEMIKALSDLRDAAGSLEELGKQEEKMKYAYGFYKLATSHFPVWEYQKFKSRVTGDFLISRARVNRGTSPALIDVRVFMKNKLGIDCSGMSDEA